MIEKLEPIKCFDCSDTPRAKIQHHNYHNDCINKINEIVDAVNEIMTWRFETDAEPIENTIISKMENVDPYAEQCEWIGKLCRFWDDNLKITKHIGILTRIDERAIVPYEADDGFWYCACKPVKPDDDIIYKGGDNE